MNFLIMEMLFLIYGSDDMTALFSKIHGTIPKKNEFYKCKFVR